MIGGSLPVRAPPKVRAQLRPAGATREATRRRSGSDGLSSGPPSQDDKLLFGLVQRHRRDTHTPSAFSSGNGPGARNKSGWENKGEDGRRGGRGGKDGWKEGKVGQWPPLAAQESCLMSWRPESRAGGAPAGHTHEYKRWQRRETEKEGCRKGGDQKI